MSRTLLTLAAIIAIASLFAAPQVTYGQQYKKMPWHLTDIWWDLGESRSFESYSIDVTIDEDIPETIRLYIAPVGLAHLNDTPFYGGLQTQSDGYTKANKQLRGIGRGLLMSMWDERSPTAIRPAAGGFWQSSGHEGDFVSIRRPFKWTKGKYTFRVVKMDRETVLDEQGEKKECTWVGAFLYSHVSDENIFIGALRFPQTDLKLSRNVANFVEIYGPKIAVDKIPQVTITFSNPTINGKTVENASASAIYPDGVPDFAHAKGVEGGVVIKVGEEVKERKKRQEKLF
ncbi:MAG: hypothetical protein ACI9HK_002037 [Pirellulaceae bacterium]|jgi:hypothetical protein